MNIVIAALAATAAAALGWAVGTGAWATRNWLIRKLGWDR